MSEPSDTPPEKKTPPDLSTGAGMDPAVLKKISAAPLGAAEALNGQRIGRWQLLRELGRGGMGVVFEVQRVDGEFHQRGALKLLQSGVLNAAQKALFLRERQILAQLIHPNIATLLDGGTAANGVPFLVMELVEGQDLIEYVQSRKLDLQQRLALFAQLCSAVACAHEQLVIHRDIKPSNILVDASGQLKLMDFGIAKSVLPTERAQDETATPITLSHSTPEQLQNQPTTVRSDIYQLGLVLFQLLTGERAHPVDQSDYLQTVQRICRHEITPPSRVDVAAPIAAADVRGDLDAIVLRACRTRPADRYPSVAALAADVQAFVQQRPIAERRNEHWYRVRKLLARNRLTAALVAAFTVTLLGAVMYYTWALKQERDRALDESEKARALAAFLPDVLASADPDARPGHEITVREILDDAAASLQGDAEVRPAVRLQMHALLSRIYSKLGLTEKACEQLRLRNRLRGASDGAEQAIDRLQLADCLINLDQLQAADEIIQSLQPTAAHRVPAMQAHGWVTRADLSLHQGHRQQAIDQARTALTMTQHLSPRQQQQAHNVLAFAHRGLNQFDQAIEHLQQVQALNAELYPPGHSNAFKTRANLANVYLFKGDLETAERIQQEALMLAVNTFGESHPVTGDLHNSLGLVRFFQSDYSTSATHFVQAREIAAQWQGAHSIPVAMLDINLANVKLSTGRPAEARTHLYSAREIYQRLDGADSHHLIKVYYNLLRCELEGDLSDQSLHWGKELARLNDLFRDDLSLLERARNHHIIADVQQLSGDLQGADASMHQALSLYRSAPADSLEANELNEALSLARDIKEALQQHPAAADLQAELDALAGPD